MRDRLGIAIIVIVHEVPLATNRNRRNARDPFNTGLVGC